MALRCLSPLLPNLSSRPSNYNVLIRFWFRSRVEFCSHTYFASLLYRGAPWQCTPLTSQHFSSSVCFQKTEPSDITESKAGEVQTATYKQKAKENVKTASYGMVIVVGITVTGVILYTVLKELFSRESPVALFQMASEKCVENPKVQDLLGEPIKAFGEEDRRGRRRHVTSLSYVDEQGKKGTRVVFYLQGLRKRATAQIDARQDENGKLQTRYIIVTADDLLRTSVVVEDNR